MTGTEQGTIDWIDGMAAAGTLFADDLRSGLGALLNSPEPRDTIVQEKINAWTWLLQTNHYPERGDLPGSDGSGGPLGGFSLESIPMGAWVALGLLVLMLARKK